MGTKNNLGQALIELLLFAFFLATFFLATVQLGETLVNELNRVRFPRSGAAR